MKTYSNRFVSMEQQPCGGWIVVSLVCGLPLDNEGRFATGEESQAKIHRTYATARETMVMLTERYRRIERGIPC
jgi:hypothetical protein